MAETVLLEIRLEEGNTPNQLANIEERLEGLRVERNRLRKSLRSLIQERDLTADSLNDLTNLTRSLGSENISTADAISLLTRELQKDRGESETALRIYEQLSHTLEGLQGGTIDASEASTELGNTTQDLNVRFEALNARALEVASEMGAANLSFKDASREKRILQREASAVTGSLLAQRTELIRLKNEFQNLTPNINTTEEEYEQLRQKIKELNDSILEQERSIGVNQRNVGNYREAFEGAIGSIIPGLNLTNLRLAAGGALFLELGKQAIEMGKRVIEAISRLRELRQEVGAVTGAEGDALDVLTARFQALTDTYDVSFDRLIESSNNLAQRFQISQEAASEFIATGLEGLSSRGQDELLDIVREYPEFFRIAGVEASEFIAIANQQIQDGYFSDKGVDAIKEGIITIREMPDAAREALERIGVDTNDLQQRIQTGQTTLFESITEISERLQTFPEDSNEVGQVFADVFRGAGQDAGDFIINLANITTSLEEVAEGQNETAVQTRELRQANEELQLAYNRLLGPATSVFTDIQIELTKFLGLIINRGLRVIEDLANTFVNAYNSSLLFRTQVQLVGVAFNTVVDIVQGAGRIIFRTVESLAQAGRGISEFFAGNFREAGRQLQGAFNNFNEGISRTAEDIAENFRNGFTSDPIDPVTIFTENPEETLTNQGKRFATSVVNGFEDQLKAERERARNAAIEALSIEAQEIEIELINNTDLNEDEEFGLRRRLIEIEKEIELQQEEITTSRRLEIQKNYIQSLQNLEREFAESRLENRLSLINADLAEATEGSSEYFNLLRRQLQIERNLRLQSAELSNEDRLAIQAEYIRDLADLNAQQAEQNVAIQQDLQLGNLEREYEQQLIDLSTFHERRNQILADFERLELENFRGTLLERTRLEQENQIARIQREREFQQQLLREKEERLLQEIELDQTRNDIAKNFSEAIISIAGDEREAYRETADGRREDISKESVILKAGLALKKAAAINEIRINLQRQLTNISLKASQDALIPGIGLALSTQTLLRKVLAISEAAARTASVLSAKLEDGGQVRKELKRQAGQYLESGGLLRGPSHKNGGVKAIVAGRFPIEMEGGEYVNNTESTRRNIDILERINSDRGRTSFELVPKFQYGGRVLLPQPIPKLRGGGPAITTAQVAARAGFAPLQNAMDLAQLGEIIRQMPPPVVAVETIEKQLVNYERSVQFDD